MTIKRNELIPLIFQIKENRKKKDKMTIKNKFHDIYCQLIENVVENFENKDLEEKTLDNYAVAQLSLCSLVAQWIKTKDEVILSKSEIDKVFQIIIKFINKEYGDDFLQLFKILDLYKKDEIEKIVSPIDAIRTASIIIKNFHPKELNSTISDFILKLYDKFKKYSIHNSC